MCFLNGFLYYQIVRKYYDQITISFGSEPSSGKYEDLQFIGKKTKTKNPPLCLEEIQNYFKQKNHFKAWNYKTRMSAFKINIKISAHLLSPKQRSASQYFNWFALPLKYISIPVNITAETRRTEHGDISLQSLHSETEERHFKFKSSLGYISRFSKTQISDIYAIYVYYVYTYVCVYMLYTHIHLIHKCMY